MKKRGNGEGTWGKKKVGKRQYFFFRDSDGNYTYGKTKQEVKEKLEDNQKLSISPKTTFGEYISEWLLFKKGKIEQTTYEAYENLIYNMILKFKSYNLANKQIQYLTPKVFQSYLNTLATSYSRSSITKIWAIIKQCIKYGETQNELPTNLTSMVSVPLESNVAHKKKEIPFLNEAQAEQLYDVLNYRDKNNVRRYNSSNNAHAIILILYTGMRVSEMIALKWKNVDLKNKTIKIVESAAVVTDDNGNRIPIDKPPKSKSSIRSIPLPERAVEMIKYFKKVNASTRQTDYVCQTSNGTKINRRNISHTLEAMCKDANLPYLNVHALRHSYGSILLSKGVNIKIISELLGHANVSITYDIYIGIKEDEKKSAVEEAFNKTEKEG